MIEKILKFLFPGTMFEHRMKYFDQGYSAALEWGVPTNLTEALEAWRNHPVEIAGSHADQDINRRLCDAYDTASGNPMQKDAKQ